MPVNNFITLARQPPPSPPPAPACDGAPVFVLTPANQPCAAVPNADECASYSAASRLNFKATHGVTVSIGCWAHSTSLPRRGAFIASSIVYRPAGGNDWPSDPWMRRVCRACDHPPPSLPPPPPPSPLPPSPPTPLPLPTLPSAAVGAAAASAVWVFAVAGAAGVLLLGLCGTVARRRYAVQAAPLKELIGLMVELPPEMEEAELHGARTAKPT
eukprot:7387711-Prymnesium_polylepis.1